MKAICGTDIGLVRNENQDRIAIEYFDDAILGIVCDGMGGASCGSEASTIAIQSFLETFKSGYRTYLESENIKELLLKSIENANSSVYTTSLTSIEKFGMGTTCVAVFIKDDGNVYTINVGDSRAYVFLDNEIVQLTIDHNYAQFLYQMGEIRKEEIETHPERNMLMRAVGVEETVDADFFDFSLEVPFKILLCSDGLYAFVPEDKMLDIVLNKPWEEIPSRLIQSANANGGRDNISLVVIEK